jgi:hypothetical protein
MRSQWFKDLVGFPLGLTSKRWFVVSISCEDSSMKVQIAVGNVLDFSADVLISTANPWLNMSGGVNAAIHERCPEIQTELHAILKTKSIASLPPGSVVRTSAGSLPFQNIIHDIAIDAFYDSSIELIGILVDSLDNRETNG